MSTKMSQKTFFEELGKLKGKLKLIGQEIRTKTLYSYFGQKEHLCPIEAVYYARNKKVGVAEDVGRELGLSSSFMKNIMNASDLDTWSSIGKNELIIRKKMLNLLELKEKE